MDFDATIGVVVGLTAEARIARRLGWKVAVGGGTAAGAFDAAQDLAVSGAAGLVSFGLAGGLDPALPPGAVVVPTAVLADGLSYPTDSDLSRALGGVTDHVILGADAILDSVAAKHRSYRQTGAAAVDLESGAVARVAAARRLPFAALRVICDPAGYTLPPAALAALGPIGAITAWRILASLAAHPRQFPALVTLTVAAAAARRALVGRVSQLAPKLSPAP